jgi:hypothetical protein
VDPSRTARTAGSRAQPHLTVEHHPSIRDIC